MATLDVIDLPEAKAALNLSGTSQYDAELPGWITAVSQLLDVHVGPIVVRTITDELHDGTCMASIQTNFYPVKTFTTVTEYSDTTGTVLTRETNVTKPDSAYIAPSYSPDPTLFSGTISRRTGGSATRFAYGAGNIAITYDAGRFNNTASVAERFKLAAKLTLQYLWNSQRPNLGNVGEFEIPQQNWPKFAVPNAVREMFPDEWQVGECGELLVG